MIAPVLELEPSLSTVPSIQKILGPLGVKDKHQEKITENDDRDSEGWQSVSITTPTPTADAVELDNHECWKGISCWVLIVPTGWLITTRTLQTQHGLMLLHATQNDLRLVICELLLDELTRERHRKTNRASTC
eukprot:4356908-Amphidinium_carterae.1